jgi:membrane protein DedA with SNARE-associated domain
MEDFIANNLSTYGPLAVFLLLMLSGFGLALGEEMVTIPAGVFIATGRLDFLATAVCAYVGIVAADCMWFAICRHYGTPLLHKRWMKRLVHPRRMLQAKHQVERRGAWLIVMVRFIPSSRTSTITVAGMLHMPFWRFFIATASCVLITVPTQLGIGYLIGRQVATESLADLVPRVLAIVALIILTTLVIGAVSRYRAEKRGVPRAKASWLRRFRPRRTRAAGSAQAESHAIADSLSPAEPVDDVAIMHEPVRQKAAV